ncbi:TerD family protein, partial [Pseudonocardia sp. KRD-188]|nr:TerD family protein [Pseudonocardia oceani]
MYSASSSRHHRSSSTPYIVAQHHTDLSQAQWVVGSGAIAVRVRSWGSIPMALALLLRSDRRVLADHDVIFNSQPTSPDGLVRHGSEQGLDHADLFEEIRVDLPAVPAPMPTERAVVLFDFYRRDATWRVRAVGQGYDDGLAGLGRGFVRRWVTDHPLRSLRTAHEWAPLLAAYRWLDQARGSGRHLREITAPGVDTKFVERHRDLLAALL